MVKKFFIIGMVLIMGLGLFGGCGDKDKGIWFFVNPEHGFSTEGLDEEPTITKLIRSVDELQQLCDETGISYEGEKYNEVFFEDKAIIIHAYWLNWGITIRYDSVQIVDGKIVINLTRTRPKGPMLAVVFHCFSIIEVSEADLANATEIQINAKNKTK